MGEDDKELRAGSVGLPLWEVAVVPGHPGCAGAHVQEHCEVCDRCMLLLASYLHDASWLLHRVAVRLGLKLRCSLAYEGPLTKCPFTGTVFRFLMLLSIKFRSFRADSVLREYDLPRVLGLRGREGGSAGFAMDCDLMNAGAESGQIGE